MHTHKHTIYANKVETKILGSLALSSGEEARKTKQQQKLIYVLPCSQGLRYNEVEQGSHVWKISHVYSTDSWSVFPESLGRHPLPCPLR